MNDRTYIFRGTLMAEQPLATCSADLKEREAKGKGSTIPVPRTMTQHGERLMFPATGIRGRLRRQARDVIRQAVIESTGSDKPFSLEQHYFLTLGGIKGSDKQDRSSVADMDEWRRKNPLLSVFGAGDAGLLGFVGGRLSVGNAICRDPLKPVTFSGARSDDFYRDKDQVRFLSDGDIEKLIAQARGTRERSTIKAEITKLNAAIRKTQKAGDEETLASLKEQKADLDAEMEAVKKKTGVENSVGMPLAGWKAIPQGALMDHQMILTRANAVELGLVIEMLAEWAQMPIVGAHYSQGCGLVSAQWEAFEVSRDGKRSIGHLTMTPFEPLQVEGEIEQARDALREFLASDAWDFSIPTKAK